MRRPFTPLSSQQLQLLLRRCFSSSPSSSLLQTHNRLLQSHISASQPLFQSPPHHRPAAADSLSSPFSTPSFRFLSTTPSTDPSPKKRASSPAKRESETARSIAGELLKDDSLSVADRLNLSFSHIKVTPSLIRQILYASPDAGRKVIDFYRWISGRPGFESNDETFSLFIDYFGRRKDFKATETLLLEFPGIAGAKTLESLIDRLVRAGRPTQTVSFFEKMEKDYKLARNRESLNLVVTKLCEHGFASYAEKMVKNLANEFFPDEFICDTLIKGWCVDKKLDEAKRLAGEMYRGGFEIGPVAYNAILDCVCKLCRTKDPFRLQPEAEKVLVDMDVAGVPRNVETFNVLIKNLCKIRKTQDAMNLFERMGEWGCHPNETTFRILIKSLYRAARVGEGDEMLDRMKSAGFGEALDKEAYYKFLKALCGIERIDHAMSVYAKMKEDGVNPGFKIYYLLMRKLAAHGRVDKANGIFKEAESKGVQVVPTAYKLDPRFVKKPTVAVKKEKKRETLPEKMARKRRRLKQIRLSYVKKSKKAMR